MFGLKKQKEVHHAPEKEMQYVEREKALRWALGTVVGAMLVDLTMTLLNLY